MKILFVCTGNQCRSPFAERYVTTHGDPARVSARSAGTLDLPPTPAPLEMQQMGSTYGLDLEDHLSRYVGTVDLNGFDLIVGFEQSHVAELVVNHGADADKVFLLGELVMALDGSNRASLDEVKERRRSLTWSPTFVVPDPIGRPKRLYVQVAETIARSLDEVLRAFGFSRPDGGRLS